MTYKFHPASANLPVCVDEESTSHFVEIVSYLIYDLLCYVDLSSRAREHRIVRCKTNVKRTECLLSDLGIFRMDETVNTEPQEHTPIAPNERSDSIFRG